MGVRNGFAALQTSSSAEEMGSTGGIYSRERAVDTSRTYDLAYGWGFVTIISSRPFKNNNNNNNSHWLGKLAIEEASGLDMSGSSQPSTGWSAWFRSILIIILSD